MLDMETTPKRIIVYRTEQESEPFTNWFNALKDTRTQARIDARLARVEAGNLGEYKSVGDGVFELRLDFGKGFRLYFGNIGSTILVLLTGGTKEQQSADIARAQDFWRDYQTRNHQGQNNNEKKGT